MRLKRANNPTGSGAPFIIVLAFLIVFYVIFLPPADREALLNDGVVPNPTGSGSSGGSQNPSNNGGSQVSTGEVEFTFVGPGDLSVQTRDEYTHTIGSFNLRGDFEATVIERSGDFIVSSSTFNQQSHEIQFFIDDLSSIKNPLLSFTTPKHEGIVTITLNGQQLFSGDIESFNVEPIPLRTQLLQPVNTLTFTVNGPGLAFWQKNTYEVSQLQILADYIDTSGLSATQTIDLRPVEIQQYESGKLRFVPECDEQLAPPGRLTIRVNEETVFSRIPDCAVTNIVAISKSNLDVGLNTITFESTQGSYLVDRTEFITTLLEDEGVTYYFELSEDLFSEVIETQSLCGEADGVCPAGCNEDVDVDCCFTEYAGGFWCDVPTTLVGDRCVGSVDSFNIDRCPSGYEDRRGDVPDLFDNDEICGDDNDGVCPAGCSQYYDADCCLVDDSDNFFCHNMPTGGVVNICKTELLADECSFCPGGYEAEGTPISCEYRSPVRNQDEEFLRSPYEVYATFTFVDDLGTNSAELIINGYKTSFNSRDPEIRKDISRFVQSYNNYIQIIPESDFSLVQVEIDVESR